MSSVLFDHIKTASRMTDLVLVSFSGGKDSVVVLDLCMRYFRHVDVFFMYYVRGLSFQEQVLQHYERKHKIEIFRIPHFELSEFLRYGTFRKIDFTVPVVSPKDIYTYMRSTTGTWWIAAGERISDSLWRRAMIKKSGSIDVARGRFFPVAEWRKRDIEEYIRHHRLKVSPESKTLGFSFRSLSPEDVIKVCDVYPADFGLIKRWFPFVGAGIVNHEQRQAEQVPAL